MTNRRTVALCAVALFVLTVATPSAGAAGSDAWRQDGNDGGRWQITTPGGLNRDTVGSLQFRATIPVGREWGEVYADDVVYVGTPTNDIAAHSTVDGHQLWVSSPCPGTGLYADLLLARGRLWLVRPGSLTEFRLDNGRMRCHEAPAGYSYGGTARVADGVIYTPLIRSGSPHLAAFDISSRSWKWISERLEGVGHVVVSDGLAFNLGRGRQVGEDLRAVVSAFDIRSGEKLWATELPLLDFYTPRYKGPTVVRDRVLIGESPIALDAKTGKILWDQHEWIMDGLGSSDGRNFYFFSWEDAYTPYPEEKSISGNLTSFDVRTGSLVASIKICADGDGAPPLVGAGLAFVTCNEQNQGAWIVDLKTGEKLRQFRAPLDWDWIYFSLVSDGKVLVEREGELDVYALPGA